MDAVSEELEKQSEGSTQEWPGSRLSADERQDVAEVRHRGRCAGSWAILGVGQGQNWPAHIKWVTVVIATTVTLVAR
jgi:hypothetical protein